MNSIGVIASHPCFTRSGLAKSRRLYVMIFAVAATAASMVSRGDTPHDWLTVFELQPALNKSPKRWIRLEKQGSVVYRQCTRFRYRIWKSSFSRLAVQTCKASQPFFRWHRRQHKQLSTNFLVYFTQQRLRDADFRESRRDSPTCFAHRLCVGASE